jgi:Ca2+-binding RTX toxin-like protein
MIYSTAQLLSVQALQRGSMSGAANDAADATAPRWVSYPRDGHAIDADLVFTFSEAIQVNPGTFTLATADGTVYSGSLTDNPHITVSGNTIVVNPPSSLAYGTNYWVEFSPRAVADLAGNLMYDVSLPMRIDFLSYVGTTPVDKTGTDYSDLIHGSDAADTISGGASHDWLYGHGGDDTLRGDDEVDTLYGDDGNDRLYGGKGTDWLFGGAGDDVLEGGADGDTLEDLSGNNTLLGGEGNDHLISRGGSDLDGGVGNDIIDITLSGSDARHLRSTVATAMTLLSSRSLIRQMPESRSAVAPESIDIPYSNHLQAWERLISG